MAQMKRSILKLCGNWRYQTFTGICGSGYKIHHSSGKCKPGIQDFWGM